jgi:hypothetical protein
MWSNKSIFTPLPTAVLVHVWKIPNYPECHVVALKWKITSKYKTILNGHLNLMVQ